MVWLTGAKPMIVFVQTEKQEKIENVEPS